MGTPVLIGCAAAVLVALGALVAVVLRSRAESRRALARAVAETDDLRLRLDELAAQLEHARVAERARAAEAAYVITDAGRDRPEPNVPDRLVLTATVGEPIVKAFALGHGVRRALSAESRNRIWFAMSREVRQSRKQRRRELKEALRRLRAEGTAERPGPADSASAA